LLLLIIILTAIKLTAVSPGGVLSSGVQSTPLRALEGSRRDDVKSIISCLTRQYALPSKLTLLRWYRSSNVTLVPHCVLIDGGEQR
jgi:hypothetical protein